MTEALPESKAQLTNIPLEEALIYTGFGKFNILFLLWCTVLLIGVITETTGFSYIVPVSQCDLQLDLDMKTWIPTISFIGYIISSHIWGYIGDKYGRKKTIFYSCFLGSTFSILSSLSPNVITFIVIRLITAILMTGASSLGYAFLGEVSPKPYRDRMVQLGNASVTMGTAFAAVLAWIIIPLDFRLPFWVMDYRPWRLLVAMNATPFFVSALVMRWIPESPKFLVAKGRNQEALDILSRMYRVNTGSKENFKVVSLLDEVGHEEEKGIVYELVIKSFELFRPPWLGKMAALSMLQFINFAVVNGYYMWLPDVTNKVLTGSKEGSVCAYFDPTNATQNTEYDPATCDDTLRTEAFTISIGLAVGMTVLSLCTAASMRLVGRRRLLIAGMTVCGIVAVAAPLVGDPTASLALMGSLMVLGPVVGIVSAFVIDLFPTSKRGMAICLTMMFGRVGALMATKLLGITLLQFCDITFYVTAGFAVLGIAIAFTLPADISIDSKQVIAVTPATANTDPTLENGYRAAKL